MIRIFRVFVPAAVLALLISEVMLLIVSLVVASMVVIDVDPQFFLIEEDGLLRILVVVASISIGLYFQDLYTNFRIRHRILLVQQFSMAIGLAFLTQALLTYVDPSLMLPRWIMIYASAIILVLLPAWRVLYSKLVFRALGLVDTLFLGTSPVMVEIAERLLARPELGFRVIGYLSDGGTNQFPAAIPRLGEMSNLAEVVERYGPQRIVVGMAERRTKLPVYELLDMRMSGIHIDEEAALYEVCFGRVSTRDLRPSQLVFSSEFGPSRFSVALQSFYSWWLALAGAVILAPVMVVVAILVKLSSKGPIFHRQTRVGLRGKIFTVLKFRSMYADAEARTGAVWASKNDPRITAVGKYLRLFRLDELPQFLNVLQGEMSFVGPRPERPEFVRALSEKIPFYRQRHFVRPGITGWAQINHKYGDTIEDTIVKLEYDLYYLKHLSPSLDAYIVLNTLKTVILGRGAQ